MPQTRPSAAVIRVIRGRNVVTAQDQWRLRGIFCDQRSGSRLWASRPSFPVPDFPDWQRPRSENCHMCVGDTHTHTHALSRSPLRPGHIKSNDRSSSRNDGCSRKFIPHYFYLIFIIVITIKRLEHRAGHHLLAYNNHQRCIPLTVANAAVCSSSTQTVRGTEYSVLFFQSIITSMEDHMTEMSSENWNLRKFEKSGALVRVPSAALS
ncbi:hypothetical protein F4777DRAFT_224147 [Nemania sp. FL0916]|nr:hypothetical protein F4777DRAFT_224147 [Nemania sp. FL0916]